MDEQKLDGNAAGGILGEVFPFEMTTARAACVHCGTAGPLGASMAYVTEIGTVIRCPTCTGVLIRVVHQEEGPGRYFLDLRGVAYLQLE
ncbi:hypothetical protein BH18ACT11_BH18ACT11_21140 [soil metagenome]